VHPAVAARQIGAIRALGSTNEEPDALAEAARGLLGVSVAEQSEWVGEYDALNGWIAAFERSGVLVFQTGDVSLDEMRGFSLNERVLPVIVLNAKDSQRGRVFTMMHELVHVALSRGGVCDPLRIGAARAESGRTDRGVLQSSRWSDPRACGPTARRPSRSSQPWST